MLIRRSWNRIWTTASNACRPRKTVVTLPKVATCSAKSSGSQPNGRARGRHQLSRFRHDTERMAQPNQRETANPSPAHISASTQARLPSITRDERKEQTAVSRNVPVSAEIRGSIPAALPIAAHGNEQRLQRMQR